MNRPIRYSKKREAILALLRSTKCHPSAEWVHRTLKPTHPDLSLGTVYRNLLFFQEQAMIKSVGVVDGQERFDADTSSHCHFVCNHCHSILDLHLLRMDETLCNSVSAQYGLHVDRHELTFYGLCPTCEKNLQNIKNGGNLS